MATTKERILVTLTPDMARDLRVRAKRERSPRATVAARLLREAIEAEEDRALALIADERMKYTGRWLSHEEVWGARNGTKLPARLSSRRSK